MKRIVKFLSYFPQVPGRVWVDLWSLAALVKFILGKPIDSTALLGILGIYAGSKFAGKLASKGDSDDK